MLIDTLIRVSHKDNEPLHCTICHKKLSNSEVIRYTFLWYPMCEQHNIRARGLCEWIVEMSGIEWAPHALGKEVVRHMRLEEEQKR